MTAAAPSGVVTFLFTDVEGSTRRWEADAQAMRAALVVHDEVLRTAIEEHRGWLFKHTGDGVCAAFASPRCAVDAAVAAQRALELPVRMGIATGEAELRGTDYFGTDIDALAVAVPYCHAVFTDNAMWNALPSSPELRLFGTELPRTPTDLADWLDQLPTA
jgi:Adenylate and Guanylate cyclase catalytic domain